MFDICVICQEETNESMPLSVTNKKVGAPPILLKDLLVQCFETKEDLPNNIDNEDDDAYICKCCEGKLLEFYEATLNVIAKRAEFKARVKYAGNFEVFEDFDTAWSFDGISSDDMISLGNSNFDDSDDDFILTTRKKRKKSAASAAAGSAAGRKRKSKHAKTADNKKRIKAEKKEVVRETCMDRFCSECEVELPTKEVYKLHIKKCHPVGVAEATKFHCSDCSIYLGSEHDYKVHLQEVHDRTTEYLCDKCGCSFNTRSKLTAHVASHEIHACTICGKVLAHRRGLLRHIETHSGERKYQCAECGNRYTTKHSLKEHLMVHDEASNFACEKCGMRFRTTWHLKRHQCAQVVPAEGLSCTLCGKAFAKKRGLHRHMISHTAEKTHECEECSKKFTTKELLNQHMVIHNGNKNFGCPFCVKRFRTAWHLDRHLNSHRKDRVDGAIEKQETANDC